MSSTNATQCLLSWDFHCTTKRCPWPFHGFSRFLSHCCSDVVMRRVMVGGPSTRLKVFCPAPLEDSRETPTSAGVEPTANTFCKISRQHSLSYCTCTSSHSGDVRTTPLETLSDAGCQISSERLSLFVFSQQQADDAFVFHLNASLSLQHWCLNTPEAPPFVLGDPQLMLLAGAPPRTCASNSRSQFIFQTFVRKLMLGKTKSLSVSVFTFLRPQSSCPLFTSSAF